MGPGEAGAGARGHAAGAALGAFVGLVAGDIQFDEGARWDVEFNSATAAINQGTGSDREAAFLFDDADRFARRAAGRPDVLDDEDALAGVQLEATTKRHLAGTVAFDEQCANAQSARDFVSDDDATQSGRYDARDGVIVKNPGQSAAQGFGMLRKLEHQRALDVCGAVTAARKLEVALANGAYLLEERQDVVAFHFARATRDNPRRQCRSLMALGGSVKQTRTAEALGLRDWCYLHGGCSQPLGKAHRPFVPQGKCPLPIPTHCLN
jgi:hypothetical protein